MSGAHIATVHSLWTMSKQNTGKWGEILVIINYVNMKISLKKSFFLFWRHSFDHDYAFHASVVVLIYMALSRSLLFFRCSQHAMIIANTGSLKIYWVQYMSCTCSVICCSGYSQTSTNSHLPTCNWHRCTTATFFVLADCLHTFTLILTSVS